jgi:hypothetical protein
MATTIAINEVPEVKEHSRRVLAARQKRDEADGKIRALQASLARDAAESDPLDAAMARIDLPELQRAFLLADREVLRAEAAWRAAVEEARAALGQARIEPRRALVRALYDVLDKASAAAAALKAFDSETEDLGARRPEPMWAELFGGDDGLLEFRRRRAEGDGWL